MNYSPAVFAPSKKFAVKPGAAVVHGRGYPSLLSANTYTSTEQLQRPERGYSRGTILYCFVYLHNGEQWCVENVACAAKSYLVLWPHWMKVVSTSSFSVHMLTGSRHEAEIGPAIPQPGLPISRPHQTGSR
ncbi:hypothetical protein AV530_009895 [Patagioenas fasciata monilis]|uniref:Uncharacterized protein n=1 Tax=Patagioenas fasciata monilis TaxID=372326 RepID=A0A1V4KAD5_PATFA|nr:hypothetical protein AV530_009895 [Patagioenas fasciata monilis]